jgi:hypothetical protein
LPPQSKGLAPLNLGVRAASDSATPLWNFTDKR